MLPDPFLALVLLNILDAIFTRRILSFGGREMNPLMRALMDRCGVTVALVITKAILLSAVWYFLPQIGPWLWALVAMYVAVCIWNWRVLRTLTPE